jgi:hypothetical protein
LGVDFGFDINIDIDVDVDGDNDVGLWRGKDERRGDKERKEK